MKAVTTDNFGPLIAYLLPGFVALWGLSVYSPMIQSWFAVAPDVAPTVGGFLYVTLGSMAAGLIVSAVRWAVLDTLFHRLGIREPRWDFAAFPQRLDVFLALVDNHYRFYQFYANTLTALAFAYVSWLVRFPRGPRLMDLGFIVIGVVLFLGTRDTLKKYFTRTSMLLRGSSRVPKVPPGGAQGGST